MRGAEATTDANFLGRLLDERRIELAFENHRLFDIYRTGQFENVMNTYYTYEYDTHYKKFKPAIPLDELKNNIKIRTLLPIPQREMDSNNQIVIHKTRDTKTISDKGGPPCSAQAQRLTLNTNRVTTKQEPLTTECLRYENTDQTIYFSDRAVTGHHGLL